MSSKKFILIKRIAFTVGGSVLTTYIVLSGERFFDVEYYFESENFGILFFITFFLQWFYMLWINILYAIFIMYLPGFVSRTKKWLRYTLYVILAFCSIFGFHLSLLAFSFRIKNMTLRTSGYFKSDVYFLVIVLLSYLGWLFRYKNASIFQMLLEKLLKTTPETLKTKGIQVKKEVLAVPPTELNPLAIYNQTVVKSIKVSEILLFFFSKKKGSFFIDILGEIYYAHMTSAILKKLLLKDWMVKVKNTTYLNMWNFVEDSERKFIPVPNERVACGIEQVLREKGMDLRELLRVSRRLEDNMTQHFQYRENLSTVGWDEDFVFG